MKASSVEGSMVAERFDDGEKDKKKKRRSNRRTKQNLTSSSVSEVNEGVGVSSECSGKNGTTTQTSGSVGNSMKQPGVIVLPSNEQGLSEALSVGSISVPLNDQGVSVDLRNMHIHEGGVVSKPFLEPGCCLGSSGTDKRKDSVPCRQIGVTGQRNYFSPYWSAEAVEKALDRDDVFKAVFHVNAHNRREVSLHDAKI